MRQAHADEHADEHDQHPCSDRSARPEARAPVTERIVSQRDAERDAVDLLDSGMQQDCCLLAGAGRSQSVSHLLLRRSQFKLPTQELA